MSSWSGDPKWQRPASLALWNFSAGHIRRDLLLLANGASVREVADRIEKMLG
jgi:hypothetical protein